ncbi:uncharacterized protein LOC142790432 [Rhipicephalus microplus]|uniref:uncharacterized protein LOC142790432 n=1 Tax=Rhipicephalus microplus TaxID=6941 RepID=UPI003F6A9D77
MLDGSSPGESGHRDDDDCAGLTKRELFDALREKDRLLADLLRRLPQPESSGAPHQAAINTFQVMPDLSRNIADFSGDGCASAAREWMEGLRQTATLHRWPTPFLLETAKCHLVGAAKDWYRSRAAEISSWDDFERMFGRTFYSHTRAAERWRRMQERMQQRNENTAAYFHEKVRLCREAHLDFCDTREQVLTGLRSRELCTMLLGRSHEDADDLLHDIQEFERIDRERRERFGTAAERRAPSDAPRMQPAPKAPLQGASGYDRRDQRPPITNQYGERKCYNCFKFGHISRDCPEERRIEKCLKCGKTGHTQKHCQARGPRNETNAVSGEKIDPGVLLKQVKWNGNETLIGMIDTGSSGCLLRESAAVRCGAEVLEDATALYGFGSQGVPAARAIGRCRADLLIDGVVGKNIQILVVPDEVQSVDLLVGRTFTELPYVTYAKLGDSLQFWHRDECPFSHLEPFVSCPKLRLKTAEETPLQANVINWVRLSSQSNVTGAVLFNNCGCEILVDMEDGEVTVPVFTSRNDDVVLRKGQRLGHATEVDIPGCEMKEINECREECSAARPEQILVTEARRPFGCEGIKMDPSVTEEQRRKLACLRNEYQDCFAANLCELGCTSALSMDIQEMPGSAPVAVRPYRTNAAKREAIRDIVGECKREGIGTETHSEYASPVITTSMVNTEQRDLAVKLSEAECSLNNAVNKTIGKTPFEMLHGYRPEFHSVALKRLVESKASEWEEPGGLRERVRQRLVSEQKKMKVAYDKHHFPAKMYGVGDVVFMTRAPEQTEKPAKTQPKYRGPLVITAVLPADTYRVADLDETRASRFATTAHVSQLKCWTTTNTHSHLHDDGESAEESDAPECEVQRLRRSARSCAKTHPYASAP